MLIAMFQLAMDLTACESAAGGQGLRLAQRPSPRHRLPRGPWWSPKSGQELRMPGPAWTPVSAHPDRPHGLVQRYRPRRCRSSPAPFLCSARLGDPAAEISAAPTRSCPVRPPRTQLEERRRGGGVSGGDAQQRGAQRVRPWTEPQPLILPREAISAPRTPTRAGTLCVRSPCVHRDTHTTACSPVMQTFIYLLKISSVRICRLGFARCYPGCPLFPIPTLSLVFFFAGLAVHQIITITVSLIMVIAALITTLVLKNCCVQSGNTRRNSHQRKINQQEESCQNLTDFTPARVPSSLDIFTAYNETLQCSHECVRTPVPVYTEEALHSPGDYKTTFNGNRPSSSDRHLIPVAFVSEKWFEISC
uniref:Adherens junctions associated protein 1 n=1 Tax=Dromaius novaehollandiae TaxID=8790 RepID=A0A8C4KRX7_DRONO